MMIIHGQEYFQVSVKTDKELREIRAMFPDFDKKRRTRAAAEKAANEIKKVFPDAHIEIWPMCDLYF